MARHEQGASLVVTTSFEFSLKALEYQLSGPLLRQPLARHHLEHRNSRHPLLENLQKTPKGAIGDGCGVLLVSVLDPLLPAPDNLIAGCLLGLVY
jgi:hypothetical protein